MNETFIFAASIVCLIFGIMLCGLPSRRYWKLSSIGWSGVVFLIFGVLLMTTFKWTEVAIKISGLEVKLGKVEREARELRSTIAQVGFAVTPQATSHTLQSVLANYRIVSKTDPTPTQVEHFKEALAASSVAVIPLGVLTDLPKWTGEQRSQPK